MPLQGGQGIPREQERQQSPHSPLDNKGAYDMATSHGRKDETQGQRVGQTVPRLCPAALAASSSAGGGALVLKGTAAASRRHTRKCGRVALAGSWEAPVPAGAPLQQDNQEPGLASPSLPRTPSS